MKKVLLASTALVVTSGAAVAEVGLSGYAEMGIVGGGGAMETQFHHDIDVTFTLSGETDSGLSFGATIDLDEVGDDTGCAGIGAQPSNTTCVEEHSVFISGSFGTLTMGDTDGAFDWALTEVGSLTALADEHTSPTPATAATRASTARATVRSCATTTLSVTSALPCRS